MNFIKRGFTSIVRRPGKTAILLIIVFILGNLIAGAISVKEAVKNTQQVMRNKIGAILSIELDHEKLIRGDQGKQIESIPVEAIEAIGKSEYVKYYDYITSIWLQSTDLKSYVRENNGSDDFRTMEMGRVVDSIKINNINESSSFQLKGGQNPQISDIDQGQISLLTGRTFTEEEIQNSTSAVLISKNLADTNNLSVGQTFKMYRDIYSYNFEGNFSIGQKLVATKEFEFNIIGIFEPSKSVEVDERGNVIIDRNNYENVIYTTNKAINTFNALIEIEEKKANGDYGASYNNIIPVFVLKEPLDLEAFKAETESLLPENYKFVDNISSLENVSAPMENMEWIASIVLYVAVGSTLVILSLLITLFLRDRKHEMGIYLSLGEKKKNVVMQVVVEVLCISFVAITLSVFSGNLIAGVMSEQMLNNQIISEQENNKEPGFGIMPIRGSSSLDMLGYSSSFTHEELMEAYSVRLDFSTIMLLYLVGMGSILLSTLIPSIYVIRLNPKKIMM